MFRFVLLLAVAAAANAMYVDPYIVGGDEAEPHSWPWMVDVLLSNSHYCGGTLIDNEWVVSAAHCFDYAKRYYAFSVGGHNTRLHESETTRQTVAASDIFIHPNYERPKSSSNDIAMIKLASPVVFNDYVKKAELVSTAPTAGKSLAVTGWGALYSGGGSPDVLYEVFVPMVSDANCRASYPLQIDETMICAGYEDGGKDSCQGDSGGPLVEDIGSNGNINWALAGVVSWGYGCAEAGRPGVYSNVAHLRDWIETTMAYN